MRHYFKPVLIVLGLLLFTFSCQKDDTPDLEEEAKTENPKAVIQGLRPISDLGCTED